MDTVGGPGGPSRSRTAQDDEEEGPPPLLESDDEDGHWLPANPRGGEREARAPQPPSKSGKAPPQQRPWPAQPTPAVFGCLNRTAAAGQGATDPDPHGHDSWPCGSGVERGSKRPLGPAEDAGEPPPPWRRGRGSPVAASREADAPESDEPLTYVISCCDGIGGTFLAVGHYTSRICGCLCERAEPARIHSDKVA